MLLCKPKSFFSSDYVLEGDGRRADLTFRWTSEQGTIIVDRTVFEVRKHGIMNPEWTLEGAGHQLATAVKPSAFTRTFDIRSDSTSMVLRAAAPMSRRFEIDQAGALLATIAPKNLFSRQAVIDTREGKLDFPTMCFALWLTALTWRREAQSG
ncbi:MAG: hypothetical protein ABIT83_00985 [Massilia sp.]